MPDRSSQGQRPTIAAVAEAAGLSVATVDRVLNKRHPVRTATARRVLEAAERIGYHGTPSLRARLQEQARPCRLGVLLQRGDAPFYRQLAAELEIAGQALAAGSSVSVEFMDELDPSSIAARMRRLGDRVDALAVVSVDHPRVGEAVSALRVAGVASFALLSDLSAPERRGYIGLDARKAGRTAAWAITRLARRPGPVAIVVGSHRYLDHDTREISMRSYLRELAPDFRLLEPVVDLERPDVAYDAALTLLARQPDLAGVYVTGGGLSGVMQALVEKGRAQDVVLVGNELTPATRAGLIDGVVDLVLETPTRLVAETALRAMQDAALTPPAGAAQQIVLPFALHGPEN